MISKIIVKIGYSALIILCLVAFFAFIYGVLNFTWQQWAPATCAPDACFCEGFNQGSIVQPINTWSSLAMILVPLVIMIVELREKSPHFRYVMFCWVLIILGVGTLYYHASLSFAGQFLDNLGMSLFATFILAYYIPYFYHGKSLVPYLLYVLINIGLAVLQFFVPETRRYLFATLVISTTIIGLALLHRQHDKKAAHYAIATIITFALAFIIWILDFQPNMCVKDSLVQGHALWHILGAIALVFLYLYYKKLDHDRGLPRAPGVLK